MNDKASRPADPSNHVPACSPSRLRRSPLIPTLAATIGIVVFASAGNWQRARMEQKEALRATYEAASRSRPIALPIDVADWASLRFLPVEARGRFDGERQILIDNRVHRGRVGYHVVTPLLLDDGRAVLVNRGWVAAGPTRQELPVAPPPSGEVTIRGTVALQAEGLRLGSDEPTGRVWQHLDPASFSHASGLAVVPVVLLQSNGDADRDDLVREWPRPDFGIEKHRIYMVQWYLFALLAFGLWAYHVLRPLVLGARGAGSGQ